MERFAIQKYVPDEHTRYASSAFDSQVGKKVRLTFGIGGPVIGEARLLRASIEDEGRKATMLFEVADGTIDAHGLGELRDDNPRWSIGDRLVFRDDDGRHG